MNSLSVIIYLIGLFGSLQTATVVVCVGCMLISIASSICWADPSSMSDDMLKTVLRRCLIVFLISLGLSCILPNQRTMTLIAASEIGERVLKTDQAQAVVKDLGGLGSETTDLLRAYIQKQTQEIKNEMNKAAK